MEVKNLLVHMVQIIENTLSMLIIHLLKQHFGMIKQPLVLN